MANCPSKVAVIIPVHNGLRFTRRCLAGLVNEHSTELDIVLVDDGSTDGTVDVVRVLYPDVTVLRSDGSLWWSGATNLGAWDAIRRGAEVLVLFNNDNVEWSRGALARLATLAHRSGDCFSAVALVDRADGAREVLHAGGSLDWSDRGQRLRESGAAFDRDVRLDECDWLPGTALALTADLFERLGGVDARRFPQYRGDIDLTLRARRVGRRCFVVRDVWVLNDKGQSGLHFNHPLSLPMVAAGLVSLRSPYNLREALPFAFRHCPPRLRTRYLALAYARYFYACLKSRHPGVVRLRDRIVRSPEEVRTT
jgi:GT2 family glycosyltransferase